MGQMGIRTLALVAVILLSGCTELPAAPAAGPTTAGSTTVPPQAPTAAVTLTRLPGPLAGSTPRPTAGPTVSGRVMWGDAPVAGARVELRAMSGEAAAETTADADGAFTFRDPPAGQYLVVAAWPDGSEAQGELPAVTIAPGQSIGGVEVRLERKLQLLEPPTDAGAVSPTPTITWQSIPGVASYSIVLIDTATSETPLRQQVSGSSLAVSEPLQPGHTYQLIINGLGPGGESLASVTSVIHVAGATAAAGTAAPAAGQGTPSPAPTLTVRATLPPVALASPAAAPSVAPQASPGPASQPTANPPAPGIGLAPEDAITLPRSCTQRGLPTYVDRTAGICFALPFGFSLAPGEHGSSDVQGPARGKALANFAARLTIEVRPAQGRSLDDLADAYISEVAPAGRPIEAERTTLGGEDARLLEAAPQAAGARHVLALHGGSRYYILVFSPSLSAAPAEILKPGVTLAQADAERLYGTVVASFGFLPEEGVLPDEGVRLAPQAAVFVPPSCVVDGQGLYVSLADDYCFSFPSQFRARPAPAGQVILAGPDVNPAIGGLSAGLTLTVTPAARGKTLAQIVDMQVRQFGRNASTIQRDSFTLAGQPSMLLSPMPDGRGGQEIFMLRNGVQYHLRFSPDPDRFPRTGAGLDEIFEAVTSSFAFLPAVMPSR